MWLILKIYPRSVKCFRVSVQSSTNLSAALPEPNQMLDVDSFHLTASLRRRSVQQTQSSQQQSELVVSPALALGYWALEDR